MKFVFIVILLLLLTPSLTMSDTERALCATSISTAAISAGSS